MSLRTSHAFDRRPVHRTAMAAVLATAGAASAQIQPIGSGSTPVPVTVNQATFTVVCAPRKAFTADQAGALPLGRVQVVAHYDGAILGSGPTLGVETINKATGICCTLQLKLAHNNVLAREFALWPGFELTGRVFVGGVVANGAIDGIAVGLYYRDHAGDRFLLQSSGDSLATVSPNFIGAWPVAWSHATWDNHLQAAAAANGAALGSPIARRQAQMTLSGAQMLPNGAYTLLKQPILLGDLDADGCVDSDDLTMLVNSTGPKCGTSIGACPVSIGTYTSDRFSALPADRMQVVALYTGATGNPTLTLECRNPVTQQCCDVAIPLNPGTIDPVQFAMNGFEPTGRFTISGASPQGEVAFGVYVREPAALGSDRWLLKSSAPGLMSGGPNLLGGWPYDWTEAQWDALLPATSPFQPASFDSFVARRQAQVTIAGAQALPDGTYIIPNRRCIDTDLDGDGDVDAFDANILVGNLGINCCK